ncbi:putative oxidoreductase [Arthrobacter globiformis NBRC 12137]|uniref:Putative oxidoreductase n=1 Tax=Arthrobacter globiformis (strain ATCC 8010 / DSM 20124 / JCM 1332 / NBRC 12137 / NCIMB 8907 / NRRL B-2979 / 168) TaxID=1077972 RepID=H0QID6_ARTG1|nr:FAD-dependent monooxygenase [Arthrobacter globiformis]GAB12587.1 putative oxidoreductase [Arthrobacter globiformis NBRC 12137]
MSVPSALIAGASIAGPALAYWLNRFGWRTTVVERAPALRTGGQNVDLKGAGLEVIRRMGLEEQVRAVHPGELGVEFIGSRGQVLARFPAGDPSGLSVTAEVEILRGDLAELLVAATSDSTEYRFEDRITAVTPEGDGVLASFEHASAERFDLVVAADGIGSSTRRLLLSGGSVVHGLGVEATWATIPRTETDTDWWRWFNAPGGTISLRPDRHGTTRAIVTRTLTRAEKPMGSPQRTPDQQRALLRRTFAGAGWEADRVLDALDDVEDLYTESLGQVHAPRWSQGRLVLVGDAAYCPSPVTGMGTTLAIVGAYVLAGEIAAYGAVKDGLAAYERIMRPWVEQVQKLPPGVPRIANPTSRAGVAVLQAAIRTAGTPFVRGIASRLNGDGKSNTQFDLPTYGPLDSR